MDAWFSNELQWLDYMTGYQDSSSSNGHQVTCPITSCLTNEGHNALTNLSANGSAAFKWKLHCYWLKGSWQRHVTSIRQSPSCHPVPIAPSQLARVHGTQDTLHRKRKTWLCHRKNFGNFKNNWESSIFIHLQPRYCLFSRGPFYH